MLESIMFITLTLCALVILSCIFMSYRNHWVYKKRIELIDSDYETYQRLADYHTMFVTFWVWDVKKFIEEK